jgi:serine protease inhibitor
MVQDVIVALPKFTFRSQMGLSGALKALGMTDAFGRAADFSKMTGTRDLKLAEVYHQTYVAVAEEGTEAAAATAAPMELLASRMEPDREKPIPFIADHPFLVFIRHDATGVTLFQGRVTDPEP